VTDHEFLAFDDLGAALREARPLHPAHKYRIEFALDGLDFKIVHVAEATPTGAHILEAADLEASNDISLLAILASGEFEEVLLDQHFDLRCRGAERFVAFRTDRLFKLTLNKHLVQWGKPDLRGAVLYQLAHAGEHEAVFLESPGGLRLVEPDEIIDLATPGIEHFVTAPRSYEIIVNSRPRTVVERKVTFEEIVQLAFPGAPTAGFAFSMTFRHVASLPHQGELADGGFVDVKTGSVFNVTRTVQS
jgi:hypothetical protein